MKHILIVDDEKDLAVMMGQMLKLENFTVSIEHDSINARDTFVAAPDKYDLVITDQVMPGMFGVVLAGELKKIRPDIPIILCTGYGKGLSETDVKGNGIQEVLFKPFSMKRLHQTVQRVFDEA